MDFLEEYNAGSSIAIWADQKIETAIKGILHHAQSQHQQESNIFTQTTMPGSFGQAKIRQSYLHFSIVT